MLQVSKCLIGLAVMMLQSCDVADNRRDMLCGNWESVEGKPDVLIYKEGEAYKVTVFRRSGLRRKLPWKKRIPLSCAVAGSRIAKSNRLNTNFFIMVNF